MDRSIKLNPKELYFRAQKKFRFGPLINKINEDLIQFVSDICPDLIFIYRGVVFSSLTISQISKYSKIFVYNNDDPFQTKYPKYFWRHYFNSLKYCDHIFYFRPKNYNDYKKIGFNNISLLRAYYLREKHFPIKNIGPTKYSCNVIFVGHFENDNRSDYIKYLLENNISLKLFGPEWEKSEYFKFFKKKLGPIFPLRNEYNIALNSAKIALSFLSKMNNDSYTTRSFEIPATKTFMLSEYSSDLNNLFKEGIEAEYFRDKEELLNKIKYYLVNENERNKIAEAGYARLLKDGHEVSDRVNIIIKTFKELG